MVVAVQQPREEEDQLSKIQRALGIATTIYGVALERDKANSLLERNRLDQQKLAQKESDHASGEVTQGDLDKFARSGGEMAPLGSTEPPPGFGRIGQMKGSPVFGRKVPIVNPGEAAKTEFSQLGSLRNEYHNRSKDSDQIINAYSRLEPHINEKNPSGASDMSLVYQFNKILDPGTGVKESEFANAANTSGIADRALVYRDQLINGNKLSPKQRSDIIREAQSITSGQLKNQRQIDSEYAGLAHQFNLDKNKIIDSRYETLSKKLEKQLAEANKEMEPGHEEDGYIYIGGDKANPNSWKKK